MTTITKSDFTDKQNEFIHNLVMFMKVLKNYSRLNFHILRALSLKIKKQVNVLKYVKMFLPKKVNMKRCGKDGNI